MELILNIPGLEDIIDDINNNLTDDLKAIGNYKTSAIYFNNFNNQQIYFGDNISINNNLPIGCGGNYNFTPGSQTIEFKFNPW